MTLFGGTMAGKEFQRKYVYELNYKQLLLFLGHNPFDKYLKSFSIEGKEYKYYDIAALGANYGKQFYLT